MKECTFGVLSSDAESILFVKLTVYLGPALDIYSLLRSPTTRGLLIQESGMNRRFFLRSLAWLYSASQLASETVAFGQTASQQTSAADSGPTAARIPRWRGFNLQGRF